MAINVDLIVEAIAKGFDKVTNQVKGVGRGVEDAGESAKTGGLRFTELASALSLAQQGFQVVASAAKFAYDNIKQGAELELARSRFDNLAGSINTTSDSLLTKMRAATNGMQSDAQLIAGATDIINLGLAKTEEDTVRLATAVGTLGLDMQQVVLTFANNSKARLDALGLSVEDVTKRAEELNAEGFDGDAFDEAVLIGLEEKMELLGDASETTSGQIQQLEADWANLTDAMKQAAAEAAGPLIGALSNDIQTQKLLSDAYEKGVITWKEWHDLSVQSRKEGGLNTETNEAYAAAVEELNSLLAKQAGVMGKVDQEAQALATATMEAASADAVLLGNKAELVDAHVAQIRAAGQAAGVSEEFADKQLQAAAAQESYNKNLREGIVVSHGMSEAEKEAAAAAKEHAASMGDLFTSAIESSDGIGLFNETAAEMADRTIYVSDLTGEQRTALQDLQAEYDKARGVIFDYTLGAKGVGLTTDEVNEKVAEQQERMAELQGAMDPLLAVGGEYADIQGSMTINQDALNQAVYDSADAQGASAEQLAILGGALGLYSDEAVEAALKSAAIQAKIDELAQAYVDGKISVEDMRDGIQDFISALDEVPDSVTTDISVTGVEAAINKVGSLQQQLNNLGGQAPGVTPADATQRDTGDVGLAGGADFIVPPGYPNDSFGPLYVQSGERVTVTPSAQVGTGGNGTAPSGGGQPVTINVYQRPGENGRAFADRVATLVNERNGSLK